MSDQKWKFDPITGKALSPDAVEHRFDPVTGRPLAAPVRINPLTGKPVDMERIDPLTGKPFAVETARIDPLTGKPVALPVEQRTDTMTGKVIDPATTPMLNRKMDHPVSGSVDFLKLSTYFGFVDQIIRTLAGITNVPVVTPATDGAAPTVRDVGSILEDIAVAGADHFAPGSGGVARSVIDDLKSAVDHISNVQENHSQQLEAVHSALKGIDPAGRS